MTMTLGHLLEFGFFQRHELVMAGDPAAWAVSSVIAVRSPEEIGELRRRQFAVLDGSRFAVSDTALPEAISLASDRRSAGLLVCGSAELLPVTTRAQAERSNVPLVLTEQCVDPARLVAAMDTFVRSPELPDTSLIYTVSHRLGESSSDAASMVRVLSTALRCPVGLLDVEGRPVAGNLPDAVLRSRAFARTCGPSAKGHRQRTQQVRALDDDSLLIIQPVRMEANGPLNLRLVAVTPLAPPAFARTVSLSLGVAGWAFVAHLATVAVALERQSRPRTALLTRLVAEADAPSPDVLEQATTAGWRLGGRHTAVHVRASAGAVSGTAIGYRLRQAFAARDLGLDPIPYDEGWAVWFTDLDRDEDAALPRLVHHLLLEVERCCPGARLCAGIGMSADGTGGLRESLRDARHAGTLAAARNAAGAVERIGASRAKRLLSDEYATPAQVDLAEQLLRPLTVADTSGQLRHTLSCYLDNESSATATAQTLGVHRNTVLQRLDRIRTLLAVELTDPDERLALQLATRLAYGMHQRVVAPREASE